MHTRDLAMNARDLRDTHDLVESIYDLALKLEVKMHDATDKANSEGFKEGQRSVSPEIYPGKRGGAFIALHSVGDGRIIRKTPLREACSVVRDLGDPDRVDGMASELEKLAVSLRRSAARLRKERASSKATEGVRT